VWAVEKRELKPHVRRQIEEGIDSLAEEFGDVASPRQVHEIGEEQLDQILPDARIDDFVPALVNSNTRAELLDQANDERDEGEPEKQGDSVAPGRTGAARADTDWEPTVEERRAR
jgi:hypothetical protein